MLPAHRELDPAVPLTSVATIEDLIAASLQTPRSLSTLVAGFTLTRGYGLDDYDAHCVAAGLALAERWATWDREPWAAGGDYAVSVHQPESS